MLKDKISKDDFFRYLKGLRKVSKYVMDTYDNTDGYVDLINLESALTEPYHIIEKAFFTNVEYDVISWYLYEYDEDKMKIWDSQTKEVIADIVDDEALWEYLNRDM